MKSADSRDQHTSVYLQAIARQNVPEAHAFVPDRFAQPRFQANMREQAVALRAGLQVFPNLGLACVHAIPIRIRVKRATIEMGTDSARATRVSVFMRGSAYVIALFDHEKRFCSGLLELDGHAQAGEA